MLGTMATGAFSACGPSGGQSRAVTTSDVYTNNHYIPGVGYYHAPFRAWYPQPYNSYDPTQRMYYYAGQWSPTPCQSITNLSSPTDDAVRVAQTARTDVRRSGFGSTSRRYNTWS
jgi:hypothetical protein